MGKIIQVIAIFTLLFSMNAVASNLHSTLADRLKSKNALNTAEKHLPIIYGGKDLSRSIIAEANESLWVGQPTVIG